MLIFEEQPGAGIEATVQSEDVRYHPSELRYLGRVVTWMTVCLIVPWPVDDVQAFQFEVANDVGL